MKKNKKDLPDGVPEENVYENTHILLLIIENSKILLNNL